MKRLLSIALLFVLLTALLPAQAQAANETVTINVYNWGQYLSDGTDDYINVIEEFEAAYPNIKVNYMTYDSNESMYTKLKTGGSLFDIIIPSDYMVEKLIAEDMLEPLDMTNIPNFQYIDESFRDPSYDPGSVYSVPYTWGGVGVIYNTNYVDEADTGGWELLWNEKYAGKILMFDNPRDAFAIAQLELGYDINTEDSTLLTLSANLLRDQKPLVQMYVMDQVFNKMQRGEAWIAPYYAGDFLLMVEENPDLAFYYPEEGFNLFIDAMCIPKSCQNKAAAEAYINFLCDAQVAGENLDYLGYSTPISAAKEYMDPDMVASDIAYPSEDTLAMGSAFSYLGEQTNQLMDSLWLEVKTQGSVDSYAIVSMAVLAVGLAAYFTIHGIRKKKRIANRCKKWKTQE